MDVAFRDMQRLSAVYYDVEFSAQARSVLFKHNQLSEIPGIKIWAIRKTGAGWQAPEDWTEVTDRAFCRNQTEISELVLIISNSDWQGGAKDLRPRSPALTVEDHDCTALVGNVDTEVNYHGRVFSVAVSGLRFTLNDPDPQDRYTSYILTGSPAVTWHASGTDEFGCTISGEMHLDPADGTVTTGLVNGSLVLDREEGDYNGLITGSDPGARMTATCGGAPSELVFPSNPILKTGFPNPKMGDGPVIEGEYVDPSENYGGRWTWHFEPAP